ncbi:MAG: spherulation-specific family 4 protein, partial [Burkholderiales bacterium]
MAKTYVIYYGWLTDQDTGEPNDAASRIAAAKPPLLIANVWTAAPQRHLNLSPQVLALLHAAGTAVYAYVATNWGKARMGNVKASLVEYLDAGADGVLLDEADALCGKDTLPYYAALSQLAWDRGKTIIVNTGRAQCSEATMRIADRVMVEHQWRDLTLRSPWASLYEPDRFMGVSSNEPNAMRYALDAAHAIGDTLEAWEKHIGWHTSTERFIALPDWFEPYMAAVNED